MFTVYGIYPEGHHDGYTQFATLDEALAHLHELIANEQALVARGSGTIFSRYGLYFDESIANEPDYELEQMLFERMKDLKFNRSRDVQ